MFGGLASQCTFSVHWRDATPLQGGVGGGGGGGGGAGGVYFLWEDCWRRVLNSPTVPAETTLLSRLFHSRIVLGKKLFLKTGVEACWM